MHISSILRNRQSDIQDFIIRSWMLKFLVAFAVVAIVFNVIEFQALAPRAYETAHILFQIRGPGHAAVFFVVYLLSVAGLVVLLNLKNRRAGMIALGLLIVLVASHVFMLRVFSEKLSIEHINTARESIGSATDFFEFYGRDIAVSVGIAVISVLLVRWAIGNLVPSFGWKAIFVPLCALLAVGGITWRTLDGLNGFYSPFRVPVVASMAFALPSLYSGPREPVPESLIAKNPPDADVIILIVDESVNGEFLSINGYNKETTPFLASKAAEYVNLGIASSAANASALANIILMSGLQPRHLPDVAQRGLRGPNVFQFAKQADFTTIYMDAQSEPQKYIDYMRKPDEDAIDVFYRLSEVEKGLHGYESDRALTKALPGILERHPKVFIYMVKSGAHFPYDNAYPPSERVFMPGPGASSPAEMHYTDALRWSVDGFFKELMPLIDPERTAIIYTADHGQAVGAAMRGVGTHGKVETPPRSQATVPMLMMGAAAETRVRPVLPSVHDRTTHFQIFPSLLIMMGYAESEISSAYGIPLWKRPSEPRVFLSGNMFRGRSFLNTFD